jgi:2-(1,2-epoxy-1,2-dihydrophenyl)acetyl-CoA isomerase
LACDVVIAAESASFTVVFGPKLAIIPDAGCTWFLSRLVGRARARALSLLGDPLPATTAAEWGLIWRAVPDQELPQTAREIAGRLAAMDALAAARINETLDAALHQGLHDQLALEARVQRELINRPGFAEGIAAFVEKRSPRFDAVLETT